METMVVNNEFLKGYKNLSVVLENGDVFEFDVHEILHVNCSITALDKKGKAYFSDDGVIKISEKAMQKVEKSVLENGGEQEGAVLFKQRLEVCDGCADMVMFSLMDEQGKSLEIYVPYDPLTEVIDGEEIEYSNCPSVEFDEDGNAIILFGKSSKKPQRIDNNYAELIEGWGELFGDYEPEILKVKAESLSTWGKSNWFLFEFKICDKQSKIKRLGLIFKDCSSFTAEQFFPIKKGCVIVMSKMLDGQIFVGLDGLGIEFICGSVWEYGKYNDTEE